MIKVVVPVSGGKDSQACLKMALQEYDKSEVIVQIIQERTGKSVFTGSSADDICPICQEQ